MLALQSMHCRPTACVVTAKQARPLPLQKAQQQKEEEEELAAQLAEHPQPSDSTSGAESGKASHAEVAVACANIMHQ